MRKRDFLLPSAVFILLSLVLSILFLLLENKNVVEEKERYVYIATNQANNMKDSVDKAIARVYTFSALIRNNDGDTLFFDTEAPIIYEEIKNDSGIPIKNVAIAPQGVVEKVYPMDGNEQLIGFNFMDISKPGNIEAVEAYEKGEVVVTNPFDLVQGGKGMASRLPVMITKDDKEEFWGLVTVTLDFDRMMESFDLDNLSKQKVNYRLWYNDDNDEEITLAISTDIPTNPVTYDFEMQNIEWHLDVAPQYGWHNYLQMFGVLTAIVSVSLLISLLLIDKIKINRANEKLERLAHLDGLTYCYSRHYVNTILINSKTGEWNNPDVKYSLAMIDIDNFKIVNDTFGHEAGDKAIKAIASILKNSVNKVNGDCVIRQGGDEFIVLWNNITQEQFEEKLRDIVKEANRESIPQYPELNMTVSIGGEYYSTNKGMNYYEMLKKADSKLYKAKGTKNQFVI